MMEVRIYFECLEQAYHYIFPIVQKVISGLKGNSEIRLIKLRKNYSYYSKKIAPILFWKEPDALITIVEDKVEHPLLLIEFSNAVFTEDHELQRFDGLVAAAKNNCIYVKISPTSKVSPSEHGGRIEFDYAGPFAQIQRRFGKVFFHFEWECDKKGVVKVNPNYLSCPDKSQELDVLLNVLLTHIIQKGYTIDWIDEVVKTLKNETYFAEWLERLEKAQKTEVTTLNTSRTRWLSRDPVLNSPALELKLNRFGHAMDPERGMLAYYGIMDQKVISKMLFDEDNDAWYKDIPKEDEIRNYIKRNGLSTAYDFLYCFALGSGLHSDKEFTDIVKAQRKAPSKTAIIDLTSFVKNNFFKLSKPLKTIFGFSSLFVIEDSNGERRVVFRWEHYGEPDFFMDYADVTPIVERTILEEDDVTYITIHNILRTNGYKIIAASYPGAQADRVILVEPGTGRRQKRKYIDIICYLPDKTTNLQENKDIFQSREIQEDINELSRYKTNEAYRQGLKNFQERYAPESLKCVVKIGVGFWSDPNFTISRIKDLDLKKLDYFVYISNDRKHWNIWRTGNQNMFSINNGDTAIPQTYDIVAHDAKQTESLEKYFGG